MKQFLFNLYLASTDFTFYRQIVKQGLRSTFQYFFLLLFAVSLIVTTFYTIYIKSSLDQMSAWSDQNLPEMVIQEGVLSSRVPQPYIIPGDDFVFILDTTGVTTRFEPTQSKGILVMKDRIRVKHAGVQTQDIDLKMIKQMTVNATVIRDWKRKLTPFIAPFIFLVLFLGMSLTKTLQAYCLSLVTSIVFPVAKSGLEIRNLFNLTIYAATPAILMGVILQSLKLNIPYFGFIYFAMYLAFFIGAFLQCKSKQEPEEDLFS